MNKHTPQPHTDEHNQLTATVLERLEREGIAPTKKVVYRCRECLVWMLWVVTVLFGALSVAVIVFASQSAQYELFEATHDSWFAFFLELLPVLWALFLLLMLVFAYYNVRHTRRGYRYGLLQIVGSSMIFSIVGGFVLYFMGVGFYIDTYLGRFSSMYTSIEERELIMWQEPREGRLLGVFVGDSTTAGEVRFEDISGAMWTILTSDLHDNDQLILRSRNLVRMLGVQHGSSTNVFHACGVFPWMYDQAHSLEKVKQERRAFVERMYAHRENFKERLKGLEEAAFSTSTMPESVCGDMLPVRRIEQGM